MRRYRSEFVIVIWLVASVAMIYGQMLRADFVQWDDDTLIYDNPHLTGLNFTSVRWMFTAFDYVVRYQPLTWLTWAGVAQFFGRSPSAYHLANLIFHGVNACLVFFVVRELLLLLQGDQAEETRHRRAVLCAGIGALLWAVNPLRVEAVAWVSALLHCQACFFLLLSAWCYLQASAAGDRRQGAGSREQEIGQRENAAQALYGDAARSKRQGLFYWASVGCYTISLFSYPVGLGFVFVPLIMDVWLFGRFQPGPTRWWNANARRIYLEKIPFVTAAALVVGITLWARLNVSGGWLQASSLTEFGLGHRFMQACYIWAYYLWKPWVPFELAPVYTTLLSFQPTDEAFGRSLMLLIFVTIVLVTQRRRWPRLLGLWLSYLALLVPLLGLTEHPHYPSDRYSYVVGILWSIAVAAGLLQLAMRPKIFAWAMAGSVVIIAFFANLSSTQARVWQNSEVLFRSTLVRLGDDPYRADLHWRLGMVLAAKGRLEEAITNYRSALSSVRNFAEAHHHLGVALERQNKIDEALEHYLAALQLKSEYAEAHCRLGFILAGQGKRDEAIAHLQRAVSLDPKMAECRAKLAALLGGGQ